VFCPALRDPTSVALKGFFNKRLFKSNGYAKKSWVARILL
jgi:hypothetical protein